MFLLCFANICFTHFYYSIRLRIQEVLELDTVIKKIGRSEWWRVVIGWVVEVGGKNEWWMIMIGWEENVGEEIVIFWNKSKEKSC